jgi:hypothetical protein
VDDSGKEGILFNGCYFAATGAKSELQAFVKGVIHKLLSEQDSVQWTDSALSEDRRIGALKIGGWLVSAGLAASLLYLILRRIMGF